MVQRWLRRADEFLAGNGKKGGARQEGERTFDEPAGSRPLGWLLVEDGVLTADQVARILARRRELNDRGGDWTFGEVAIEMGLATVGQVQHALERQLREDYGR